MADGKLLAVSCAVTERLHPPEPPLVFGDLVGDAYAIPDGHGVENVDSRHHRFRNEARKALESTFVPAEPPVSLMVRCVGMMRACPALETTPRPPLPRPRHSAPCSCCMAGPSAVGRAGPFPLSSASSPSSSPRRASTPRAASAPGTAAGATRSSSRRRCRRSTTTYAGTAGRSCSLSSGPATKLWGRRRSGGFWIGARQAGSALLDTGPRHGELTHRSPSLRAGRRGTPSSGRWTSTTPCAWRPPVSPGEPCLGPWQMACVQ